MGTIDLLVYIPETPPLWSPIGIFNADTQAAGPVSGRPFFFFPPI